MYDTRIVKGALILSNRNRHWHWGNFPKKLLLIHVESKTIVLGTNVSLQTQSPAFWLRNHQNYYLHFRSSSYRESEIGNISTLGYILCCKSYSVSLIIHHFKKIIRKCIEANTWVLLSGFCRRVVWSVVDKRPCLQPKSCNCDCVFWENKAISSSPTAKMSSGVSPVGISGLYCESKKAICQPIYIRHTTHVCLLSIGTAICSRGNKLM